MGVNIPNPIVLAGQQQLQEISTAQQAREQQIQQLQQPLQFSQAQLRSGMAGYLQRQQALGTRTAQVGQAQQELVEFKKQTEPIKQQIQAYNQEIKDWELAQTYADKAASGMRVELNNLSPSVAAKIREIWQGEAVQSRIDRLNARIATIKTPEEFKSLFTPMQQKELTSAGVVTITSKEIPTQPLFSGVGVRFGGGGLQSIGVVPTKEPQGFSMVPEYVRARTEPFNLFSIKSWENMYKDITATAQERKQQGGYSVGTGVAEFTSGGVLSVLGSVKFGKGLVTKPVETIKAIPEGIKQTYEFFKSGAALTMAKERPLFVAGYVATTLIGAKALSDTGKAIKSGTATTKEDIFFTKTTGTPKTPLSRTFPYEYKFRLNEPALRAEIAKRYPVSTKIEREFILGQIKAKIRTQPEAFATPLQKATLERLRAKEYIAPAPKDISQKPIVSFFPEKQLLRDIATKNRLKSGADVVKITSPEGAFKIVPAEKPLDLRQLSLQSLERKTAPTVDFFKGKDINVQALKNRLATGSAKIKITSPEGAFKIVEQQVKKPKTITIMKFEEPTAKAGEWVTKTKQQQILMQLEKQEAKAAQPEVLQRFDIVSIPKAETRQAPVLLQVQATKAIERAKPLQLATKQEAIQGQSVSSLGLAAFVGLNQREQTFQIIKPVTTTKQDVIQITGKVQLPRTETTTIQIPDFTTIQIPSLDFTQATIPEVAQTFRTETAITPKEILKIQQVWPKEERRKKLASAIKIARAYKTLIKRRGRFFEVGKGLAKGEAVKLGESKIRGTLGRTFKIEEMKAPIAVLGLEEYKPSAAEFRGFQIRKGAKIPLKDTFIKIKGLQTRSEVREIQSARRSKLFGGKFRL